MPFIAHNIVRFNRDINFTLLIGKRSTLGAQVRNDYNGIYNLGLYSKWNIEVTSPRSIFNQVCSYAGVLFGGKTR